MVPGDGNITKEEFVADWTNIFNLGNSKEAETLFGRADSDQDGAISDHDLPAIFAYFDMNGKKSVVVDRGRGGGKAGEEGVSG